VVLESRLRNRNGKCGTPKIIGALSDRYSRPAAPKRRAGSLEGLRTMRLGWLVRAAFVLRRLTYCSPFVLLRIIAPFMQSRKGGWSGKFF
jgi:hypothetical protein